MLQQPWIKRHVNKWTHCYPLRQVAIPHNLDLGFNTESGYGYIKLRVWHSAPSTARTWPEMKFAASLNRKTAAFATSAFSPKRWRGISFPDLDTNMGSGSCQVCDHMSVPFFWTFFIAKASHALCSAYRAWRDDVGAHSTWPFLHCNHCTQSIDACFGSRYVRLEGSSWHKPVISPVPNVSVVIFKETYVNLLTSIMQSCADVNIGPTRLTNIW